MNSSKIVINGSGSKHSSRLISAMGDWQKPLKDFVTKPDGVFGSVAIIKSGNVTINSKDLDLEFNIPFDDDMEPNEAEIIIYNLSSTTINNLKKGAKITVEAGYEGDTGVVFAGYISTKNTKRDGSEKATTLKCLDDTSKKTLKELTFSGGTKASYILKTLINKTGIPIAVFKMRRDHTYKDETKIDGSLFENIKKFADVCGVSVYVNKGKIYARHIKQGDNINFTVEESTGMIGSPESYEEELTAEDFKETIKGYTVKMLLQHRMTTAAIINLKSREAKGSFRVRSGKHIFNESECITEVKVM